MIGSPVAAVVVGGPAVAMGLAFPRLFDGLPGRRTPGVLVAVNTLGSVFAAWAAGNVCVPLLGMRVTLVLAVLAYVLAAAILRLASARSSSSLVVSGFVPAPGTPGDAPSRTRRLAFLSGLLAIGFEILLFRRLPFHLEGFQPTFAGVLAGFLVTMAIGAASTALWPSRWSGTRGATVALVLGIVGAVLGLHEFIGPMFARQSVTSDLGYHLRILGAATLAAAPVGLPAGAVVPLLLAAYPRPRAAASRGLSSAGKGSVLWPARCSSARSCRALRDGVLRDGAGPSGFAVRGGAAGRMDHEGPARRRHRVRCGTRHRRSGHTLVAGSADPWLALRPTARLPAAGARDGRRHDRVRGVHTTARNMRWSCLPTSSAPRGPAPAPAT